jgi:hypothetical protein
LTCSGPGLPWLVIHTPHPPLIWRVASSRGHLSILPQSWPPVWKQNNETVEIALRGEIALSTYGNVTIRPSVQLIFGNKNVF